MHASREIIKTDAGPPSVLILMAYVTIDSGNVNI